MSLPPIEYRVRLAALIYGALLLGWLSLEDNGVLSVALLGTGLAAWLTYFGVWRFFPQHRLSAPSMIAMGFVGGAGGALGTTALMFFKTAWHGHLFPDYPFGMMIAMLQRVPVWGGAGAMVGLALWLILDVRVPDRQLQEEKQ